MRAGLAALLLAAACASRPAPRPATAESCAVAVVVRTRHFQQSEWGRPATVYFARIAAGGDPFRGREILRSNHVAGGTAYLLDAPPGRYVAVGCVEKRDGRDVTTTFPAGLVAASEQTVAAGGFAFLGSFEVDQESRRAESDAAQGHYARLIEPDWDDVNLATRLFGRSRFLYGGRFRALAGDAEARAREHLAASGWPVK